MDIGVWGFTPFLLVFSQLLHFTPRCTLSSFLLLLFFFFSLSPSLFLCWQRILLKMCLLPNFPYYCVYFPIYFWAWPSSPSFYGNCLLSSCRGVTILACNDHKYASKENVVFLWTVDNCRAERCLNQAACKDGTGINGFECHCQPGYVGPDCRQGRLHVGRQGRLRLSVCFSVFVVWTCMVGLYQP